MVLAPKRIFTLIVTYCVGEEVVNCLESLSGLPMLLQGFVNPVFTSGMC